MDGGKEVHGQKLGHGFRTNIHFDFAAWVPERQASWAVALYAVPISDDEAMESSRRLRAAICMCTLSLSMPSAVKHIR